MKLICKYLYQIITSKSYGVGDEIPKNKRLSNMDSISVYRAKKFLMILSIIGDRIGKTK